MLKIFKVRNFKNFRDECTIDFSKTRDYTFNKQLIKEGLVNKALLYGYNGSGKSNLGYAIMDINNHLTDKMKSPLLYQNYLCADSIDPLAEFTYVISSDGKEIAYTYTKDVAMLLHSEKIEVNGKLMFQYNYESNQVINNFQETKNVVFGNRTQNISAVKFMRNNTPNLPKDSPVEIIVNFAEEMLWFRSVRDNEYMGKLDTGERLTDFIIHGDYVKDFQSFLSKCGLNYDLEARKIPGGDILVIKYGQKTLEFFSAISTGTQSLTLFYYWVKKCQHQIKFLYLDEFDAFYHTKLSKYILNYINDASSFQSILTTHNTYLADNSLMRPDCYFIIKDGQVKSFADRTDKVIREGHSLEHMLLSDTFE